MADEDAAVTVTGTCDDHQLPQIADRRLVLGRSVWGGVIFVIVGNTIIKGEILIKTEK